MRFSAWMLAAGLAWVLPASGQETAAAGRQAPPDPERFARQIEAFEEADAVAPPPRGAIVCIGSSSMRGWHANIREDLAPLTVIPRGFGGSTMNDARHFADRIVIPYAPRAVLLYEGDNDIALGMSPEDVLADFRAFVSTIHEALPETRIYVISIKPSISRWGVWPEMERANALLAADCAANDRLTYIDAAGLMLDETGSPRDDIFLGDNLHMNRSGYELWRDAIRPVLIERELRHERARDESAGPGFHIGIAMVGGPLEAGGDDVGPAGQVSRMILTDTPAVTIAGIASYSWPECQPEDPGDGPNVYDWSRGDARNDARFLPGKAQTAFFEVYGNTPAWLEFNTPRYWRKFGEFVEAMTVHMNRRYGDVDFVFENEPNSSRAPADFEGNWADWYMHCLPHFYAAVHRARTATGNTNRVIAGNLAGRSAGGFAELYARGLKEVSDVLGDHPYPFDIRDGVAVWDLAEIRAVQLRYGDGDKKIYVSEGWGSGRSAGFDRSSPTMPPSADEIANMHLAMTVGWDNLMTPRPNWDPRYLYGAIFFTGNDNWGARNWRRRATVRKDEAGNVTGFVVDGYPQTPDIAPQFWNGGYFDWYGNSKDCLGHLFPGDGLVLMNPGFELASGPPDGHLPHFWTDRGNRPGKENCALDDGVFRGGSRSLRLTRASEREAVGVRQATAKRSIQPGARYRAGVWCRVKEGKGAAPSFFFRYVSLDGARASDPVRADGLDGAGEWRRMVVESTAPEFAAQAEVGIAIEGIGTAWFDDVVIARADEDETGTIRGYTLDELQEPVPHAVVRTTTGGYEGVSDANGFYEIRGVGAGTFDLVCRKAGHVPHRVRNQTVAPGRLSFVSFNMGTPKPGLTVAKVEARPATIGAGRVTVGVTVANAKPYPVTLSDVGVFVEREDRDVTGDFTVVPSSLNPRTVPANGSARFEFALDALPAAAGGAYGVNAYAFGQEDRPNLLKNGGFDADDPLAWWDVPESSTVWMLDGGEYHSAPYSLRCRVDNETPGGEFFWAGNRSAQVAEAAPASPGRRYIVGAHHKDRTTGRVDLNLFIEEYFHDGVRTLYNGRRFSAVPKRSVWAHDCMVYETGDPDVTPGLHPTNRLRVSVGAWVRPPMGGSSESWWDDVYLKEEGDWLAADRAATGATIRISAE